MPEGIPPGQITITNVTEGDSQVTIEWTDPLDIDFAQVEIRRTPGTNGNVIVTRDL